MKKYTLRIAKSEDAKFLFKVKTEAMEPTSAMLRIVPFDYDKEFKEYLAKFEPEKTQVIQYEGKDVGRLRIVRSHESIYIGGIQILPEFQNNGIGTAIINDIIQESESLHTPIHLEVHYVNQRAILFYKKLGFRESGSNEKQLLMKYLPRV